MVSNHAFVHGWVLGSGEECGQGRKMYHDRYVYCNRLRKSIAQQELSPWQGLKLEPSGPLALLSAGRDSQCAAGE